MRRKLFGILTALGCLVLAGAALAASTDEKIPEFNPLCWRQDECTQARATLLRRDVKDLTDDEKNGWLENEEPCDRPGWGKCLPGGKTITEISFGGRSEFAHIGDFLQHMYKYIIGVAAILAVVMLIIAGFQYVTSGGSSEAITSARKRIGGALMGLFLAYLSFFILNALNPALVRFRMPSVWLLKPQQAVPDFCADASTSTVFALAANANDQLSSPTQEPNFEGGQVFSFNDLQTQKVPCGTRLYMKGGGKDTCFGNYCSKPGDGCSNFSPLSNIAQRAGAYQCMPATVSGNITYAPPFGESGCTDPLSVEGWEIPEIVDIEEMELWAVCNSAVSTWFQKHEIDNVVVNGSTMGNKQSYLLIADSKEIEEEIANCEKDGGGIKGFVLKAEMNESCDPKDENHWLGWTGGAKAKDLGDDYAFLDKLYKDETFSGGSTRKYGGINFFNKQYFIPADKIRKGGVRLDINANKGPEGVTDIDEEADRSVYDALLK